MDNREDSKAKVDGFFPDGLKPTNLLRTSCQSTGDKTTLVWDLGNDQDEKKQDGHVKLYLRPPPPPTEQAEEEEEEEEVEEKESTIGTKNLISAAATSSCKSTDATIAEPNNQKLDGVAVAVSKQDNDNDHDNKDERIEESMLKYQRQLRKTQAAKRAGAILTKDQLEIVYEDDSIVVVNKPTGVLTVPGIHNNDSVANLLFARIQQHVKEEEKDDDNHQNDRCQDAISMTVHRLDMDTSGLVVFGKTKSIVSSLHQVFRRETPTQQKQRSKKKNNNNRKRKKHSKPSGNSPPPKTNQQTSAPTSESFHTTDISADAPTNSKPSAASSTTDKTSSSSSPLFKDTDNKNDVVVKEYEALVCGHIPLEVKSGYIDLPLQRDIHHPPFMRVSTPAYETLARQVVDALRERNWTKLSKRNPKSSQTKFRVIQREYYCGQPQQQEQQARYDAKDDDDNNTNNTNNKHTTITEGEVVPVSQPSSSSSTSQGIPVTRLSLIPITGRTHQLRVHCAAMGFPIVGDPVYGLYGESAFAGGLFHNPVEVVVSGDDNTINSNSNSNSNASGEESIVAVADAGSSTEKSNSISSSGSSTTSSSLWRAPVSLQKQIMEVHTPGVKDMCLHAKKLGFPHPVTKIMREWEVEPKF